MIYWILILFLPTSIYAELFCLTKNADTLDKMTSQNWLIENSITNSKMKCLARCSSCLSCLSAIFYSNQILNCYLYSKYFASNELIFSNSSNLFFRNGKNSINIIKLN